MSATDRARMLGSFHAQRRVLISGQLTSKGLALNARELVKLDMQSNDPITILLESGGGDVYPTHQLEDMIQAVNSPVDVIALGDCCSMAVDLMQMCRTRMSLPSSRFLVHYIRHVQKWICDDPERLETDLSYFRERIREIHERRLSLYTKRTGLPVEKILEMFRHGEIHEAKFSAQQAIELRLIDKIVTDFKFFPRKTEDTK